MELQKKEKCASYMASLVERWFREQARGNLAPPLEHRSEADVRELAERCWETQKSLAYDRSRLCRGRSAPLLEEHLREWEDLKSQELFAVLRNHYFDPDRTIWGLWYAHEFITRDADVCPF